MGLGSLWVIFEDFEDLPGWAACCQLGLTFAAFGGLAAPFGFRFGGHVHCLILEALWNKQIVACFLRCILSSFCAEPWFMANEPGKQAWMASVSFVCCNCTFVR